MGFESKGNLMWVDLIAGVLRNLLWGESGVDGEDGWMASVGFNRRRWSLSCHTNFTVKRSVRSFFVRKFVSCISLLLSLQVVAGLRTCDAGGFGA